MRRSRASPRVAKAAGPVLLVLAGRSRNPGHPGPSSRRCAPALSAAQAGQLVTFGVVASRPETGYGYIQRGGCEAGRGFRIARFVEGKPNPGGAPGSS